MIKIKIIINNVSPLKDVEHFLARNKLLGRRSDAGTAELLLSSIIGSPINKIFEHIPYVSYQVDLYGKLAEIYIINIIDELLEFY